MRCRVEKPALTTDVWIDEAGPAYLAANQPFPEGFLMHTKKRSKQGGKEEERS
jgi:hypothetical protein